MQPLNGRNVLDSAVSLSLGEACVVGADLCGETLECGSESVCAIQEEDPSGGSNKKASGVSNAKFNTAIIITALVTFFGTLALVSAFFLLYYRRENGDNDTRVEKVDEGRVSTKKLNEKEDMQALEEQGYYEK